MRQAHRLLRSAKETISFPMLVQLGAKGHRQGNVDQTCINNVYKHYLEKLWTCIDIEGMTAKSSKKKS